MSSGRNSGFSNSPEALAQAEFLRRTFSDPFFLPHTALGLSKITRKNIEWMTWGFETRRGLFLGPPQHYKSTSLSVVLPILFLLANPESCGFIGSKTLSKAEDFIRTIRQAIRGNPALASLLYDSEAQDSDSGFTVKRNSFRHDPSLKPIAPGASLVKSHADWAILDDLVDQRDESSPAERDKTIKWFRQSFLRAMTKGAKILVVGQRWADGDLYGHIEENAKDLGFEVYSAPALRDGAALDPEIFTVPELEAMRQALGTQLFELQWNQNAAPMRGNFFKWEWFPYYKTPPPANELLVVQGVDLAISKKETAHYTVVATVAYHPPTMNYYLLHIRRGRWGFKEQIRNAETEAEAWQPVRRRAEAQAYQEAFVETSAASKYHIAGVKVAADKVMRARRLQAIVESGKFFVPEPELCEWSREFLKEACAFPVKEGKGFDDQVDAVVHAVDEIGEAQRPSSGATANPSTPFGERGSLSGHSRIMGRLMGGWRDFRRP